VSCDGMCSSWKGGECFFFGRVILITWGFGINEMVGMVIVKEALV
jgi:hypothetical protein